MSATQRGLIQVYTGEGKGKTTAAMGLALRASGHGLRVLILQFLKGGRESGERTGLRAHPGIEIEAFGGEGWVSREGPTSEEKAQARRGLARAAAAVEGGEVDLLILDEVNVAVAYGLFSVEEVLDLLKKKPESMEIVLTGRGAHPLIVEEADLVTEMKAVKHPYQKGVRARRGIEF